MNPKEKAAYLVVKYMSKVVSKNVAKECALVALDEILPIVNSYENALSASQQSDYLEYWEEVKEEIQKA